MILDKNKALKSLKKKGFVDANNRSLDHKYLEFFYEGKLILHTKVSHGSKGDLDNYLIKQMSSQCKLDKNDFADLVNCPLSAYQYLEKLQHQGLLD